MTLPVGRLPSRGRRAITRLLQAVPGAHGAARSLRQFLHPESRAIWLLERRREAALLQPSTHTWADRYPDLFDALALRLRPLAQPRVLSFGCSSGEEVRALRQRLPHARIDAVDANPRVLARAKAADRHPQTDYRVADRPDPDQRYDAVTALAVFRHRDLESEAQASCRTIMSHAHAAEALGRLDAVLKPGGWLALTNVHFDFADLLGQRGYSPVAGRFGVPPATRLYGADDRVIPAPLDPPVLYCKNAEARLDS